MTLNRLRRGLYRTASVLGDVQAVRRGPVAIVRRAERRLVWRAVGRLLRRVFP